MPNDEQLTRMNPNAFLLITVALLLGVIGGYVARPHFESNADERLDALQFDSSGQHSAFPYTFKNRSEAVEWLRTQIAFLDRFTPAENRSDLDAMKHHLSQIESDSQTKIPRPLLLAVNDRVQLLQQQLPTASPPQASTASLPNPGGGTIRRRTRDD